MLSLDGMDSGTISVIDLKSMKLVAIVDSFIMRGWQPESIILME